MAIIFRLLTAGVLLSASVNAVLVTPGESDTLVARANHRQRAYYQRDVENSSFVVEKSEESEEPNLEARTSAKKTGLAWAGNPASNIPKFVSSRVGYMYTWSPYCPAQAAQHGIECCPMLWGKKQISQFQSNKYKGGKCVMGMNEVNVDSQGKLSVADGVSLWNEYIRPMKKQGYYLVTPSTTSGDDGIAWLKKFFQTCGGTGKYCQADALAFHYYGTSVNDFIKWANAFHAIFPGDLWVTEIACQNFGNPKSGQCTKDQIYTFMEGVTSYIKKTDHIKNFFFFGLFYDMYNVNPLNRMVNKDGTPNGLGKYYLSL